MINHNFDLEKAFQEILYSTEICVNEGYGWIIESVYSQYINMSTFRPLSGSSYIKLSVELRNSKKGLTSLKNNNQKCFLWCHIRQLNSLKIHPERITQNDKKLIDTLDYEEIEFPVSKKYFDKIEVKNKICINAFCYESKLTYPVYISNQKFENSMDLSIISDKIKSHYR